MRDSVIGLGALVLALATLLLKAATRIILVLFVVWLIGALWPVVARSLGLPYTTVYQTFLAATGREVPAVPAPQVTVSGVLPPDNIQLGYIDEKYGDHGEGFQITWGSSIGAKGYRVEVYKQTSETKVEVEAGDVGGTAYHFTYAVDEDTPYFIRVGAVDEAGGVHWSEYFSFSYHVDAEDVEHPSPLVPLAQ
jgi:hypothetical protein